MHGFAKLNLLSKYNTTKIADLLLFILSVKVKLICNNRFHWNLRSVSPNTYINFSNKRLKRELYRLILNQITRTRWKTYKSFQNMTAKGEDPWRYQCGKCGSDFGSASERDKHQLCCGKSPRVSRKMWKPTTTRAAKMTTKVIFL